MENKSSNRSFGVILFIIFLLISLWPLLKGEEIRIWSLFVGLIFLILGLIKSNLLAPFNTAWIKFGEILGRVIAPIVMAIVYFIFLTPMGLLMRLLGKDLLKLQFIKNNSYWVKRDKNVGSMKRQF